MKRRVEEEKENKKDGHNDKHLTSFTGGGSLDGLHYPICMDH
jgi:hypothetical protein